VNNDSHSARPSGDNWRADWNSTETISLQMNCEIIVVFLTGPDWNELGNEVSCFLRQGNCANSRFGYVVPVGIRSYGLVEVLDKMLDSLLELRSIRIDSEVRMPLHLPARSCEFSTMCNLHGLRQAWGMKELWCK
jgi:hypothetical protein